MALQTESSDRPGDLRDESITMARPNFRNLPEAAPPTGYRIRSLRADEVPKWTEVQRASEPLIDINDGLFHREFGTDASQIQQRCFAVVTDAGEMVGVVSGWHSPESHHPDAGRIHWLAVLPKHRRRGLARALVGHAMREMARWHETVWLSTSTSRLGALRLYLDVGFVPECRSGKDLAAWRHVAEHLPHPALLAALKRQQG